MATSGFPTLDPLNLWRDALSKWEGSANQLANKQMGSEDFARAMNGLLGLSLGLQQALGKANGALLKELNLPSRNDLVEIGARLQRIEEALEQLTRRGGDPAPAAAPGPARAMPPRTRKPPGAAAAPATAAATAAVKTAKTAKAAKAAPAAPATPRAGAAALPARAARTRQPARKSGGKKG